MFNWLLTFISSTPWAYVIVLVIVAGDAFLPILPGETSIITASLLASQGHLWIVPVWWAGLLGVVLGDAITYGLGMALGRRAARRFLRNARALRWLDWARRQLQLRGRGLIIGGRFIPGARTTLMFAAGTLAMPWKRFITADTVGAILFTSVYTLLGYLGGQLFQDNLWLALGLALAIAAVIAVGGEAWRRLWLDRK